MFKIIGNPIDYAKKYDVVMKIRAAEEVEFTLKDEEQDFYTVMYENSEIGLISKEELKDYNPNDLILVPTENAIEGRYIIRVKIKTNNTNIANHESTNNTINEDWIKKGLDVGMSEDEILFRLDKMINQYNLKPTEIEAIVSYWTKPSVETKDYIPSVEKIIYSQSVEKEFYRALGHITVDKIDALRIVGSMSTGKNVFIESLASLCYKPLLDIDLQRNTESEDFEGRETLAYKEFDKQVVQTIEFIKQPLIIAMETGSWVNFNELNFAQAHVLARLHRVLDTRKSLYVSGLGEIKAKEGFTLMATMNPPQQEYVGANYLNEALESRMMTLWLNSNKDISNILEQKYPNANKNEIYLLNEIYKNVYNLYKTGDISESYLSIRRYEAALTQKGFGSIEMSIYDHLENISCNDMDSKDKMHMVISMVCERK